jgi:PPOX class probable F420-dependent enzyme
MPNLDENEIALLEGRRIGSLGTINPDGTVHLTAIWFLFQADRLLIPTSSSSRKAKNVQADPRASVMVDVRTDEAMRGVVVRGRATVVTGVEAKELNRLVHERYLTDEALADQTIGPLFEAGDDVTVVVDCESVVGWDMAVDPLSPLFSTDKYLRPLAD